MTKQMWEVYLSVWNNSGFYLLKKFDNKDDALMWIENNKEYIEKEEVDTRLVLVRETKAKI